MRTVSARLWIVAAVLGLPARSAAGPLPVYRDIPYEQDFGVRYYADDTTVVFRKVVCDRNGNIRVLCDRGLMMPHAGQLLYPGTLVPDLSYQPMSGWKINGLILCNDQLVYLTDQAIVSNAWAGKLYAAQPLPSATVMCAGRDSMFLIAAGAQLSLIQGATQRWSGRVPASVMAIRYEPAENMFWCLTASGLIRLSPGKSKPETMYTGSGLTCFTLTAGAVAVVGTHNGYMEIDLHSGKPLAAIHRSLPATDLTAVEQIRGRLWFGSSNGAFMLRTDGRFNYYLSERWLPSNRVVDIAPAPDGNVLVLTTKGLGKICFKKMTLEQKAACYEDQVRQRHIRYGFYSDYANVANGNVADAQTWPRDSDNLWTSMYLSAELFRWLVTHDEDARDNCLESLDAMERLTTLSGIPGLFGRCIERHGVVPRKEEYRDYVENYWYPGYARTPSSWRNSPDSQWDWRGSASSDQAVGQFFALTMVAQYMTDTAAQQKAIRLIDGLAGFILDNGLKIIDYNGRPTLWGIWAPEYVNRFPVMVGDRKLYSSNIISFLQTAYHFTGKEKYKAKAMELLYKNGYLQNLMRPVSQIGKAPATADIWSRTLSGDWNNSDDEMYFLAYWGLYPYALTDSLRQQYAGAIRDHWNFKRPAKDALWNLCYGMTGAADIDLDATVWELKEMPLDLINWPVVNSTRKDLVFPSKPVRGRPLQEILPPDERPENKHNRNLFTLDSRGKASTELGGGDVYLLPYWMGRYFGRIGAPEEQ